MGADRLTGCPVGPIACKVRDVSVAQTFLSVPHVKFCSESL